MSYLSVACDIECEAFGTVHCIYISNHKNGREFPLAGL